MPQKPIYTEGSPVLKNSFFFNKNKAFFQIKTAIKYAFILN
jgi:hypothetical protein